MEIMIYQKSLPVILMYSVGYVAYSWFANQIICHFLTLRKGWGYKVLSYFYCYIICSMVILMGDVVNILGTLAVTLAGAMLLFRDHWQPKLSVGMLLFVLAVSISAIGDESSFYYHSSSDMEKAHFWMMSIRLSCRFILWAVSYLVLRKSYPRRMLQIPSKIWGLIGFLSCVPAATILVTFMMHAPYGYDGWRLADYSVYILMVLDYIAALALWRLVSMLDQDERLREEQRMWELRKVHYENLEKEQLSLRRMRHDIANHLQTLSGLQGAQAEAYLQEWMNSPVMRPAKRYSDNEVANTVIASKMPEMERLGIRPDIRVSLPELVSMKKMDLACILANALDNALEACAQVEEEKRYLKLKAVYTKGLFLVEVRNSMAGEPVLEDGKLQTAKKDAARHGIGLQEIEEICRQYQGAAKISWTEGEFVLSCSVPVAGGGH